DRRRRHAAADQPGGDGGPGPGRPSAAAGAERPLSAPRGAAAVRAVPRAPEEGVGGAQGGDLRVSCGRSRSSPRPLSGAGEHTPPGTSPDRQVTTTASARSPGARGTARDPATAGRSPRPPNPRFSGARGTAREPATARRPPRPPAPASQGRGELRETPPRPAGHHGRQPPFLRGAGNCANPPAPRRSPPPPHPSLSANPAVQRTSSPAVMSSASTPGKDRKSARL